MRGRLVFETPPLGSGDNTSASGHSKSASGRISKATSSSGSALTYPVTVDVIAGGFRPCEDRSVL
jgi:hypothetical protein